jgi:acyl-CoA oxidase
MSKNELDQIPDMPKGGPLQVYRDKATFNWKKMKLFLDDIEFINYRVRLIESLKLNSVFCFCF